jgi:two-component system CheB/CheR fusion protein
MKKTAARRLSKSAAAPVEAPPTARSRQRATASEKSVLPIVGIGASAGGLEALELFLKHVPPACGLAFVVVQHLDPTRKGMLVELLQRTTAMPVLQIKDCMIIAPDHVYVIPPNRDLSILHGVLHLLEPSAPRGLRLPIDFFLRALAADQQERSLCVILSGMGSDGTLGLRAIKENAGAVFVQTPASAKFDGMPRSAINSGLADVVAPAEELPGKILAHLQPVPLLVAKTDPSRAATDQSDLEKVVILLRTQTGHDFSLYKKSTLYRRIERRMGLHQLAKIADYVRFLRDTPAEAALLFKELLIGVTGFFRDPAVWEQLKSEALPALLAANPNGGVLRAWVTGCSTGEEAYSLAIVFREAVARRKPAASYSLQIFATDLDKDAIDTARTGAYPANIAADVPEPLLRRWFAQDERGYRINKEIREMVIFAPQNLVRDPPFTRLDVLTCRNLLIYLEADLQKKLLPMFHYNLNSGGLLVLGNSETIGAATDLFAALPGKTRLYRRQDAGLRSDLVEFPTTLGLPRVDAALVAESAAPALPSERNLQVLTETLLLQHFSSAAVLTNDQGVVVYVSGKTGKYLEPAVGKANLNLFAMARAGLGFALNEAFLKAVRQKTTLTLKGLSVRGNGGTQTVDISVQPLTVPEALRGMVLIVFTEVATPLATKAPGKAAQAGVQATRLAGLTLELRQFHEERQTLREEMQTSQEVLKSTNEELQSTNEELQSTNEELTTSQEELQSMNEELQTVNHELLAKVDELSMVSDDMKNLFNSTEIATLFLDGELKVRRFTQQTTSLIKLIPGDVGRPITDLVTTLDYPALAADAREVLRALIFHECRVPAGPAHWFRVRIMPYRTQDNRIDGVVITFVDISVSKALEATLREAQAVLQSRFTDQTAELDTAKTLEGVLQRAQAVLEKRFTAQTTELRQSRADLVTEKGRKGK